MARTLLGQLILRVKAEGLKEADRVVSAMDRIENKARTMGAGGFRSWGIGFQKQLDRLRLTNNEIQAVERSWINLHDSFKNRSLDRATKGAEISHWKTNTVSALAAARGEIDNHFKQVEKGARAHATRMQNILKPALVMLGAYTLPYFGGILGMEALTASSERRREIFRQRTANIPEEDRNKIFDRAEELSAKYPSASITAIMEMARNAYTLMGNADRANAVLERMVQSFVALQSAKGPETAVQQLIGMLRGIDNLGLNKDGEIGIERVLALIEEATKAAQIDPDFDPATYFTFAKRTKTAGPALSPEFLARVSVYMQDQGPDTVGNQLAMAFKAFVLEAVGSAGGKKYLAERDRLGIRDKNGLVDRDLFGSDPDLWVAKYLIPALEKDGVDMTNDTAIAAAIGKLSGNSNATALLTRMVTQQEQIQRWLEQREKALGTEAAEDARYEDPFIAWDGFKKALKNLSAALIPIDAITAGINALADSINAFAEFGNDHPAIAAISAIGGILAGYKGAKWGAGKIFDMFDLKASATALTGSAGALDGSAAALTRAAAALGGKGGGGVMDEVTGNGKKPPAGLGPLGLLIAGFKALASLAAFGLSVQSLGETPGDTYEEQVDYQRKSREGLERLMDRLFGDGKPDKPQQGPDEKAVHDLRRYIDSLSSTGKPQEGDGGPIAVEGAPGVERAPVTGDSHRKAEEQSMLDLKRAADREDAPETVPMPPVVAKADAPDVNVAAPAAQTPAPIAAPSPGATNVNVAPANVTVPIPTPRPETPDVNVGAPAEPVVNIEVAPVTPEPAVSVQPAPAPADLEALARELRIGQARDNVRDADEKMQAVTQGWPAEAVQFLQQYRETVAAGGKDVDTKLYAIFDQIVNAFHKEGRTREFMRVNKEATGAARNAGEADAALAQEQASVAVKPKLDTSEMTAVAGQTAMDLVNILSVSAKPVVDTSSLSSAVRLAQQLVSLLNEAGAAMERQKSRVGAEMRRNFADAGG